MKLRPPRSTRTDTLFPYTTLFRSDDGKELSEDEYGFTGHLVAFTNLVLRLAAVDRDAACRAVLPWPVGANAGFTRLRISAAGHAELGDPTEGGPNFASLQGDYIGIAGGGERGRASVEI